MKRNLSTVLFVILASVAFAQTNQGLENLKSLAGEWKGTTPEGESFTVSYQVISAGSAVLERLNKPDMVTTYYLDGDNLMLTHYCMAKNQPRMKAASMEGNKLNFQFVDATNLSSADAGHMHNMTLTFVDATHIQQEWTWSDKGKMETHTFKLERVK
jgi:hypothetical protein